MNPVAIRPSNLDSLAPGHGYWVQVSRSDTLELNGPVAGGTINLAPGWKLIGFPGLPFDPTEPLDLPSVFRGELGNVPRIWRFDGGTAQRFVGYDSLAVPALNAVAAIEPGRGYGVFSLRNLVFAPSAAIALPADADVSPLQLEQVFHPADPRFRGSDPSVYRGQTVRCAGSEDRDSDLNGNGLVDGPFTQNTLSFAAGVRDQLITVQNNGGALLNWAVVSDTPWLSFDPPSGLTGTESDSVRVSAHRGGLLPTARRFIHAACWRSRQGGARDPRGAGCGRRLPRLRGAPTRERQVHSSGQGGP